MEAASSWTSVVERRASAALAVAEFSTFVATQLPFNECSIGK